MDNVLKDLYEGVSLKRPIEMEDYQENSKMAIKQINEIIQNRITSILKIEALGIFVNC